MPLEKSLKSQSQARLLTMALLCVLAVVYLDYVTGYELSFGLFYAIPILFAAWYLERNGTILVVLASTAGWWLADTGHPYTSVWVRTWDTCTRLTFFSLVAITGYRERKRALLAIEKIEREQAIEHERTRIARDIHDEIGAGLTEMALLSELAREDSNQQRDKHLGEIFSTAHNLVRSLEEIVWAVNPANDTLEKLVSYVIEFARDFLGTAGIACRLDVPAQFPPVPVAAPLRHQICLTVKETLNNTVKHSQASEVRMSIDLAGEELHLVIEDNGCGFQRDGPPNAAGSHIGLANLAGRMREVGGSLAQESTPGQGTRTWMSVKLPTAPLAEPG